MIFSFRTSNFVLQYKRLGIVSTMAYFWIEYHFFEGIAGFVYLNVKIDSIIFYPNLNK